MSKQKSFPHPSPIPSSGSDLRWGLRCSLYFCVWFHFVWTVFLDFLMFSIAGGSLPINLPVCGCRQGVSRSERTRLEGRCNHPTAKGQSPCSPSLLSTLILSAFDFHHSVCMWLNRSFLKHSDSILHLFLCIPYLWIFVTGLPNSMFICLLSFHLNSTYLSYFVCGGERTTCSSHFSFCHGVWRSNSSRQV